MGLILFVSLITLLSAQAAFAATITLNSTCSFAEAVAWINDSGAGQSGCTKSGSFGDDDTIIVGLNNQEFTIDSSVEIKKSLTVKGWSIYGTLKTTDPAISPAIKIAAQDISVLFSAVIIRGVPGNMTTGFLVDGTADTHDAFTSKLTLLASRITGFRRSGIFINQGGVNLRNATFDDNSNLGPPYVGGAIRIETATTFGRLEAEESFFSGNTAERGGAIYNDGVLNMTDCRFYDNVATKAGGGGSGGVVFAVEPEVNYYTAFNLSCDFHGNRADAGGFAIAAGPRIEFSGDTPFTGSDNTSGTDDPPKLCEDPVGQQAVDPPGCYLP